MSIHVRAGRGTGLGGGVGKAGQSNRRGDRRYVREGAADGLSRASPGCFDLAVEVGGQFDADFCQLGSFDAITPF